MDAHPGEIVYAIAGRDKGKYFLVVAKDEEFVYLADGKARKVGTPKKKKLKHIESTGTIDEFIVNRLDTIGKITNKEARSSLSHYLKRNKE
ncbi:MAG: RNA-binding protein [Ruminococcaceae bacterium]|nr:RNA-binding protein [Oscillospiraceae bacterium]